MNLGAHRHSVHSRNARDLLGEMPVGEDKMRGSSRRQGAFRHSAGLTPVLWRGLGKTNVVLQGGPQAGSAGRVASPSASVAPGGVPLVAGMAPLWCPSLAQRGLECVRGGMQG